MNLNLLIICACATSAAALSLPRSNRLTIESCLAQAVPDTERVHLINETGYHTGVVRPYNLNFPFVPISVVYPITKEEISATVKCASKFSRKVQARSGGHDYINKAIGGADGAVIVDLANFQQLGVDGDGIVTIGPGNLLRSAVRSLHQNGGWYLSHGSFPTVGFGGHAVVGGLGMTSRENGPTLDAMLQAEIILANGSVALASESSNSDLFWAIRGAGSNFGIVTEFKFQARPEPQEVHSFTYSLQSRNASVLAEAFKQYHIFASDPNLTTSISLNAIISNASLTISGSYRGSEADFKALELDRHIPSDFTAAKTTANWIDFMESNFEALSAMHSNQSHFHSRDTVITYDNLPCNKSIDALFNHLQSAESDATSWSAMFDLQSGEGNSKSYNATAYPHRNSVYFFNIMINTNGPTSNITYDYVDKAMLAIQGDQPAEFLSYVATPAFGIPLDVFYGQNLKRLESIKSEVDPTDVFSTPAGIKPAVGSALM